MKVSTEQLARLSRLLDEAYDLNLAGRREWLDALSPENQDLKKLLEELLLGPQGPDVEAFPGQRPYPLYPPSYAAGVKMEVRVGPWMLSRKHGRGGMAEVRLAQRADGS